VGRKVLGVVAVVLVVGLALASCEASVERSLEDALGGSSGSGPSRAKGAPAPPGEGAARGQLGGLEVARAGSMAGYSRDEFPHWASDAEAYGWREPDGSCDVRDAALVRDGRGVRVDEDCSIVAGSWLDPYAGARLSESGDVDIDHVVPSPTPGGAARRTGARKTARPTPTTRVSSSPPTTAPTSPRGTRAPRPGSRPTAPTGASTRGDGSRSSTCGTSP
jgi:hypothetical protein